MMNSDAFGSVFTIYSYSVDLILDVMCKPERKTNKETLLQFWFLRVKEQQN